MAPAIADFPRLYFYGNMLEGHDSVKGDNRNRKAFRKIIDAHTGINSEYVVINVQYGLSTSLERSTWLQNKINAVSIVRLAELLIQAGRAG